MLTQPTLQARTKEVGLVVLAYLGTNPVVVPLTVELSCASEASVSWSGLLGGMIPDATHGAALGCTDLDLLAES